MSKSVLEKFEVGFCPLYAKQFIKGRIVNPIKDQNGDLQAIQTRLLAEGKNKFWHESFDKGKILYGLYESKENIFKKRKCIVVEGHMDALSMHSFGFDVTVGVLGSTLTLYQIALLVRYCKQIYTMFDNDTAGRDAYKRLRKKYTEHNLHVYGIELINVELPFSDPNDFLIKYGKQEMIKLLQKSKKKYELEI